MSSFRLMIAIIIDILGACAMSLVVGMDITAIIYKIDSFNVYSFGMAIAADLLILLSLGIMVYKLYQKSVTK